MHILPVASGKGGVGKSLFSANLAISLAEAGKKVVLADLDLGGSNLHLILGQRNLKSGLGIFLNDLSLNLDDLMVDSGFSGLQFIPGDSEIPGIANLTLNQKRRLITKLKALNADYLILDLGAGSGISTLDFFLMSSRGLIVTNPSPTALVNAYLFLKNSVFRLITSSIKKGSKAEAIMKNLQKDSSSLQKIYVRSLLDKISKADPQTYEKLNDALSHFKPRLILNMLQDPKDSDKIQKLRRSCQQYLDIDPEHLGIMYRDDLQDTALHSGLPIIRYKPKSILSQAIYRISDKILQSEYEETQELLLDETYETADMEAEIDFQNRIEYIEELLNTGTLSMGDLLETVKNQQLEIAALKRENMFIKSKLLKAAQAGYSF